MVIFIITVIVLNKVIHKYPSKYLSEEQTVTIYFVLVTI